MHVSTYKEGAAEKAACIKPAHQQLCLKNQGIAGPEITVLCFTPCSMDQCGILLQDQEHVCMSSVMPVLLLMVPGSLIIAKCKKKKKIEH